MEAYEAKISQTDKKYFPEYILANTCATYFNCNGESLISFQAQNVNLVDDFILFHCRFIYTFAPNARMIKKIFNSDIQERIA